MYTCNLRVICCYVEGLLLLCFQGSVLAVNDVVLGIEPSSSIEKYVLPLVVVSQNANCITV